ncbi:ASCH domain-containing protein [Telluribacter humicola]|uniref:hypothetical protein n=1 Tax=Telluribacter humicola TaxID=1720261 RepID=UPI001A97792A|nr:hypothetical protein [Telluribacter humicola]
MEYPVQYTAEQIRAILAGQKTQDRVPVEPQPIWNVEVDGNLYAGDYTDYVKVDGHPDWATRFTNKNCPYKVGDTLWVQEDFALHFMWAGAEIQEWIPGPLSGTPCIWYKANNSSVGGCTDGQKEKGWRNAETMPREACRLVLEITDIRLERLQELSDEDAKAEAPFISSIMKKYWPQLKDSIERSIEFVEFGHRWEEIYGEGSWGRNNWVWVRTFKAIQKGGALC